MKWFKHDTDANMDAKLQEILLDYGLEGYGLYWYCLELIASNVNGENLTFELEHDSRIIARNTGSSVQKVQEMMASFIELGLFENSNGRIVCLKLAQRCDDFTAKAVRRLGVQPIDIKGLRQTPTNSEKVPLEEEIEVEEEIEEIKDLSTLEASMRRIPFEKIKNLYHSLLPAHPQVKVLTDKRKGHIRQSWRNYLGSLESWEEYFKNGVATSDFLTGKVTPANGRKPWIADFDFLINQNNIVKVSEGKYHG